MDKRYKMSEKIKIAMYNRLFKQMDWLNKKTNLHEFKFQQYSHDGKFCSHFCADKVYKNPGKFNFDNGSICVSVDKPDSGEIAFIPVYFGYGIYEWNGKHVSTQVSNTVDAWTLQGLVNQELSEFISFEYLTMESRFRIMTYNKKFHLSYKGSAETTINQNLKDWHNYKIIWHKDKVEFFIDGMFKGKNLKYLPSSDKLYFHTQTAVVPRSKEPKSTLKSLVKNFKFTPLRDE